VYIKAHQDRIEDIGLLLVTGHKETCSAGKKVKQWQLATYEADRALVCADTSEMTLKMLPGSSHMLTREAAGSWSSMIGVCTTTSVSAIGTEEGRCSFVPTRDQVCTLQAAGIDQVCVATRQAA
jgi:hypothetical protein